MSSSSVPSSPTSPQPHATIGAQSLLESQPNRYGFLRKRGQKERVLENLHLSRHINWRQRYVVIKDGCCYCYSDEVAKAPSQKFSLEGYNRVTRKAADARAQFVFTVIPVVSKQYKMHTFSATTEEERKLWMQAFKTAMTEANSTSAGSVSGGSYRSDEEIFLELEKPVFEADEPDDLQTVPNGGENEEEASDDSDYDQPDDELLEKVRSKPERRNVPLPPVPDGNGDKARSPPVAARPTAMPRATRNLPPDPSKREPAPLPKAKPKTPEKRTRRLSEKDCLFDNSDRDAAITILREKKVPGTFLIRKSRQGDSKVLAVMTAEDVKEYKIFTENNQVSLDKKSFFSDVDELLENYSKAPLPNRQQTLSRSYSYPHH